MTTIDFPQPRGVIFDCDSTLSTVEGIDELATLAGVGDTVAALTDQAMNGAVPLEAVYEKRLDLIHPSAAQLATIAEHYLATIVTGARETIATLRDHGIKVGIVSGGLRPAILPLAEALGVAAEDVFAVDLAFTPAGEYRHVIASPLTTADGKKTVVAAWKARHQLQHVVMIGDGMSDVAALGGADQVIGFGGVVARPAVAEKVAVFVTEPDLRACLPFLLPQ